MFLGGHARELSTRKKFLIVNDVAIAVKIQGSSGVPGRSCQKSINERIEECFPSFSSVVNELIEREIERQFLLRDAPMRT